MNSSASNADVTIRRVAHIEPVEPQSSDVRLNLPARPENVAVVRHVLGAFAEALHLPIEVVQDMRLAVTEACTNVVRHAYAGHTGSMEVVARTDDAILRVVVADQGGGFQPRADTGGRGLGLPLMAAVTSEFQIEQDAGRGTRVQMSFPEAE